MILYNLGHRQDQVISIIELQIQKKKSEDYNDIFEG